MGADRIKAECKKITYVTSRILKLQKYFTSNLNYKTEPTRIVCLAVSLPGSAVSRSSVYILHSAPSYWHQTRQ